MNQTAYLSNPGEYTTFSVGDRTITFLTSKNLEKRTVPIFRAWENRRLYPGGKDDIIVKISRTAK